MISVSQKHGVNPTLLVCPICRKETNDIGLLGKIKGDAEAPRYSIDNQPCEECASCLQQGGTIFIETENGQEKLRLAEPKRTGRMIGISKEYAERIFNVAQLQLSQVFFIEQNIFETLFGEALKEREVSNVG